MLPHISVEQMVLRDIAKDIFIEFSIEDLEPQLKIRIDEEKLLNSISLIVNEFSHRLENYSGKKTNIAPSTIKVKIGDYVLEGEMQTKVTTHKENLGFKKVSHTREV